MEMDGMVNTMIVCYTFVLLFCLQGSSSLPLNSEKPDDVDDLDLIGLITGVFKPNDNLISTDDKTNDVYDKRGQGWAIMYGKRGHQRWSIAYGKRGSDETRSYNRQPLFRQIKRSYQIPSLQKYYNGNPDMTKRQQGWHIAYGKRTFPSETF